MYSVDVEQFISEIKKWPALWDMKCDDFKKKKVKDQAWLEVAKVCITEFDNMSDMKKSLVYKKLQGKWRNLRDNYVRAMRKTHGKSYAYVENMSFLESVYKNRTISKPNKQDAEESIEDTKKSMYSSSDDEAPSTIDNLKRKRLEPEEAVFLEMPTADEEYNLSTTFQDEDKLFFDSLLPAVREFDLDQKLEFRTQVLQLIKSFRNHSYHNIKVDHYED